MACTRADPAAPPLPAGRPAALELFLDSRSWELVDVAEDGAALVNERSVDRVQPQRLAPGEPPAALPGAVTPSSSAARAVAALANGRVLVEARAEAGASRWSLVGGDSPSGRTALPLGLPTVGVRFLGRSSDRARVAFAITEPTGERWVELQLPGERLATVLAPVPVTAAPPGFRFALLAPDHRFAIVTRRVRPGADELLLFDRTRNEFRLLLPRDREGLFEPLAFDAAGRQLAVATPQPGGSHRVDLVTLPDGPSRELIATPCRPVALPDLAAGLLEVDCDCRREVRPIDGSVPWADGLPAGLRAVRALPAPGGGWWLATTGGQAPVEIGHWAERGLFAPATWGLSPRLDPRRLPTPQALAIRVAGEDVPGTLWSPPAGVARRGGLVWLIDGRGAERAACVDPEAFAPLPAFLASRGVAVLQLGAPPTSPGDDAAAAHRRLWTSLAPEIRLRVAGPVGDFVLLAEGSDGAGLALAALQRSAAVARPRAVIVGSGYPDAAPTLAELQQLAATEPDRALLLRPGGAPEGADRESAAALWSFLRETLPPAR